MWAVGRRSREGRDNNALSWCVCFHAQFHNWCSTMLCVASDTVPRWYISLSVVWLSRFKFKDAVPTCITVQCYAMFCVVCDADLVPSFYFIKWVLTAAPRAKLLKLFYHVTRKVTLPVVFGIVSMLLHACVVWLTTDVPTARFPTQFYNFMLGHVWFLTYF